MVITKTISRFARNTVTLLDTVREFKDLGVDIYFEEQRIHSMSNEGELMLTLLASFTQEESLSASENQKWRIRRGFQNGELMNLRFMFGYKISRDDIVPDPMTAPIVREIFDRVIAGESYLAIARDLNVRGIHTFFGYEWDGNLVKAVIRNEKYTGNSLLQKSYINNHLEKKRLLNKGELPMYYAEGTHTGIIDADTFKKAKAVADARRDAYSKRAPQSYSVFSGLIKCANCGKTYRKMTTRGKRAYNCATFINKGKKYCHGKRIPETVLIAETTAVLGLTEFDEDKVAERIEKIIVPQPNHLLFILKNGQTVERVWKDRSRAESWTAEMKESARQKAIKQKRNGK